VLDLSAATDRRIQVSSTRARHRRQIVRRIEFRRPLRRQNWVLFALANTPTISSRPVFDVAPHYRIVSVGLLWCPDLQACRASTTNHAGPTGDRGQNRQDSATRTEASRQLDFPHHARPRPVLTPSSELQPTTLPCTAALSVGAHSYQDRSIVHAFTYQGIVIGISGLLRGC